MNCVPDLKPSSSSERCCEVPLPADERVRTLVQAVLADPGDTRTASELFAAHGLHGRTVLRVFNSDIGMSFGQWRSGVRMALAARLIVGLAAESPQEAGV